MALIDPIIYFHFESYLSRLDDPTLLLGAVDVGGDLAVPSRGKRRGGFVVVDGREHGRAVIARLERQPGFPNLRLVLSADPEVCDNVCWGEEPPECPAIEADELDWAGYDIRTGRHFGYSERAIRTMVEAEYGRRLASRAFRRWPADRNRPNRRRSRGRCAP